MRIIGHYKIVEGKLITCHRDGTDFQPYLFIARGVGSMNPDSEVTLVPSRREASHILDSVDALDYDDGYDLLFHVAGHARQRVQRKLCRNSFVLSVGAWGSAVIAVMRRDVVSSVTFHNEGFFEVVTCHEGKISIIEERREVL